MTIDQLLDALVGTKESFESVLPAVRESTADELLVSLLNRLDSHPVLENSERERRFKSVYTRVPPSSPESLSLAEAGSALSNSVLRNALTQLLPAEYRGVVFRGAQSTSPQMTGVAAVVDNQTFPSRDESAVQDTNGTEEHAQFSDVIVLSITDDPATKRLLESDGFIPLRCSSLQSLDEMIFSNEEICAFLVEGSFLSSLDADGQTCLITKLASYSTFAFLRFQENALLQNNIEVGHLIANTRCRVSQPEVTDVSFRDRAGLQERELDSLRSARTRLTEGGASGLFIPGELAAPELKLLGAAMSRYSKQRRFNHRAQLTQVTTKFLQGGQTGARVALVKVDDLRVPVIVKLDQKNFILDEARRFLTFIHKDNLDLHPEVHLHGKSALIVFGIIPDPNAEAEHPAPTLEQCLTDYWYAEMRDPINCEDGAVLIKAFDDAANRLVTLNKKYCSNTQFDCKANPYLKSLKFMETQGFSWGFEDTVISKRGEAELLVSVATERAICHGDAHTRNILIRKEQGLLIDYAYSGPGHPCSDLAKLELSIYLSRFVQYGPEHELVELQRDLSIAKLSLADIRARYKNAIRSKTNEVCLAMCISARDHIVDVLAGHNLSWDHYLAIKLLASWQALQAPNLQHALARTVIAALSH